MAPWKVLTVAALALIAAGCAAPGRQPAVAAQSEAAGFVVGEVYIVTRPLKAVTWGERTSLVPELRLSKDADQPNAIRDIESGTQIHIVAIRQHDTLTHGMETWPEGIVANGRHKGMRVSLDGVQPSAHLRRAPP